MFRHFNAALLAFACLFLLPALSGAQDFVATIRNQGSGLLLTVSGPHVIQTCPSSEQAAAQRWKFTQVPNTNPPVYRIVNQASGTGMTVFNGNKKTPVNLTIPVADRADQLWRLERTGQFVETPQGRLEYHVIAAAQYHKRALDVPDRSKAQGVHMQIYETKRKDNQLWLLEPVR